MPPNPRSSASAQRPRPTTAPTCTFYTVCLSAPSHTGPRSTDAVAPARSLGYPSECSGARRQVTRHAITPSSPFSLSV
eukprot:5885387-Prymnesium_polylepis.1